MIEKTMQLPEELDIIRINSRWAQVSSAGSYHVPIKYLDDNSYEFINLKEYKLVRSFHSYPANAIKKICDLELTVKELKNIYWGPEEEENPSLKGEVSVFGEYQKIF